KLLGPVETLAGEQADGAAVEPGLDAVAVELDLVHPARAARRRCAQRRERRRYEFGQPLPEWSGFLVLLRALSGAPGLHVALRFQRHTRLRPLPSAISGMERPLATDSGSCSRMSGSFGPRAASSLALISSQFSFFSPALPRMRTRCQRPCSFSPSSSKLIRPFR